MIQTPTWPVHKIFWKKYWVTYWLSDEDKIYVSHFFNPETGRSTTRQSLIRSFREYMEMNETKPK